MNNTSKTEPEVEPKKSARRELLGSGAATAASLLLGLAAVAACSDDADAASASVDAGDRPRNGDGKDAGTTTPEAPTETDADIEPLNALLAAEYNAITAYSAGAGLITNAKPADPLYALRMVIVSIAVDFQSQHKLHAAALVEAIEELGGTPVIESEVAAAFKPPQGLVDNPSIGNVLKFAAMAERGAAVSYNQVLAGMEAAKLRMLASAIEGDESQHFIVLAALVLGLAAPGSKLSMDTADDVVPEAFSTSVGARKGLDVSPPDYFA